MAIGKKTGGGSRRGKPNKASTERKRQIVESGLTPLDFMLDLLRTEPLVPIEGELKAEHIKRYATTMDMRFEAAKAAAPYVHPRLNSTEVKVPDKIVHEVRIKIVGNDS